MASTAYGAISAPAVDQILLWRSSQGLIERHPSFITRNLREAERHLHAHDESISLSVDSDQSFRSYSESSLGSIGAINFSLGCIEASSGYELSFQSRDEYLLNIPLRGRGWIANGEQIIEMDARQVLLVTPSCRVVKHWYGPGHVLSLQIPSSAMERAVTAWPAQDILAGLAPVTVIGHGQMRPLLSFIDMVCRDLNEYRSPFMGAPIAAQAELLLTSLLLDSLPGRSLAAKPGKDAQPAVPAATAPYYIRRAEEYMRANASTALTIEDLAAAVGVSPRSLQYGFRKYRDTTPMLFLKRVRFERARSALRASSGKRPKVSDIAAGIGCYNISQFSRDYKAMFGESPSETAALPRSLTEGEVVPAFTRV